MKSLILLPIFLTSCYFYDGGYNSYQTQQQVTWEVCTVCYGKGIVNPIRCYSCRGTGSTGQYVQQPCNSCNGQGYTGMTCYNCNGAGKVQRRY